MKNNTNYEIRICSISNNVNGLWSEIKKIKTNSVDSQILFNEPKKNEFLKKIYEWTGYKNMELIFRGSRDGMYSKIFMKNVTINLQQLHYLEMIKEIFLEDIYQYLGKVKVDIKM